MSRPRKYGDRVSTAVRLPRDLHAALVEEADLRDVSVNLIVTSAIRSYLEAVRSSNG